MKFSYVLIKKLVSALKNKQELIEKLNTYSFEADDLGGNILDISIPPNRFSDAASHWGIAKEVSAIYGKNVKIPKSESQIKKSKTQDFKVEIKEKKLCPRYTAQYFENIKIADSPKWLQVVLIDCGLRPINNVVDIMNYAMLETGQPLHAFDYDKLTTNKTIIVRRAKKGEKITTLDDKTYDLNENILVIADSQRALALAGIKGGKFAEVDKKTKKIIVESANFNGVNIYKTSKTLKLSTDASLRFSHNISPELTIIGINRTAQLLNEIVGAKSGQFIDVNFTKSRKRIIKFDLERFKKFIGLDLDFITVSKYLMRLGFKIIEDPGLDIQNSFMVEAPALRSDIEEFEDVAEEVIRLYGYNKLKSSAPKIHLHPSGFEDQIVLKDKIRKILINYGLNEVSNYSFIGETDLNLGSDWKEEAIELENPINVQLKYLRPSLSANLIKNINSNFRFFDEVKIFEIGKIFFKNEQKKFEEKLVLGIAIYSKKNKQTFFELKGIIEQLFKKIGLVSYLMPEVEKNDWIKTFTDNYLIPQEVLKIESDNSTLGYFGRVNKELVENNEAVLAEIDLEALMKLIEEEHEYRPLSKYPSVMRDISILVEPTLRVGEIMQSIQEADLKYIEDVDLIDEYELELKRSLTFRIVFHAEDKTLTDKEVNSEMEKIIKTLKNKFKAIIR